MKSRLGAFWTGILVVALRSHRSGDVLTVTIMRGASARSATVTPTEQGS
jgi:S1-C subfamily serine protease